MHDGADGQPPSGEAKKTKESYLVELKHPDTPAQFWVLGTAHVSLKSAEEANELIKQVQPDVVVLELDPERFANMLREARRRGALAGSPELERPLAVGVDKGPLSSRGDSIPKVFGLLLSGDLPAYIGALFYGVSGAVLGVLPGSEFLAAAIAANEVGARVVLGDRDAGVTMDRIRARALALRSGRLMSSEDSTFTSAGDSSAPRSRGQGRNSGGKETLEWGSDAGPEQEQTPDAYDRPGGEAGGQRDRHRRRSGGGGGRRGDQPGGNPEEARGPGRLRDELRKAGCDVDVVREQFQRVLTSGLNGERIDPTDLLSVRTCGRRLVENQRISVMDKRLDDPRGGDLLFGDDEDDIGVGRGAEFRRALGREFSGVLKRTIITERDLLLARSMQEAGLHAQRVVAVVGAGHLPGIKAVWEEARTPQSYRKAKEYLQAKPEDVPPRSITDYPGTIAGVAFFGALAVRKPRVATRVVGVVTGAASVASAFAAYGVVKATRLVQQLEVAAKALPAAEQ